MKKGLILLLTLCLMVSIIPIPQQVYAESITYDEMEKNKQEEIESIFQEMEQLLLEKKRIEYLQSLGIMNSSEQMTSKQKITQISEKEKDFDSLLNALGVEKIDPQDENDIAILSELEEVTVKSNNDYTTFNAIDTAPDLATLANVFTLYIYDGTYTYNNEEHTYRYIKVVDNKGHGGLTENDEYDVVEKNVAQSVMSEILDYNFGFAFSYFLGKKPQGVLLDWTLGNIFSALEGVDNASNVIANGSKPLYRVFCLSITSMTYHYYYANPSWKLIGTSSTVSFSQTNFFSGNVNGVPIQETKEARTWSSRSGGVWYDYVEAYADAKSYNPNYQQIDRLGSITIKGYKKTFTFTPKFYDLPGYIG